MMSKRIEDLEQVFAEVKASLSATSEKDARIAELEAALKAEQIKKDDDFLNIHQVAELTGLSKHTIYKKTGYRNIPFYRIGGLLRFKKSEVMDWIEARKEKVAVVE